jgi:taurine dioxygenase/sulfonate dioxygenase
LNIQFIEGMVNYVKGTDGVKRHPEEDYKSAKYPEWLPTWDPTETFPAQPENKGFVDRGLFADPTYSNLFSNDSKFERIDLTPNFGTEVRSVQLSQLNNSAKDELALLLAERGVVVFRNQDLQDKGLEFNKQFGEYFGPLHIHSFSGAPEKYPQFHIVHRSPDDKVNPKKVTSLHTDVNWEVQTPGVTIFAILEGPSTGGDTLFVDSQTVYERLSPRFKKLLEGLSAVHSNVIASNVNGNGFLRTPPAANSHPLVRIHPVTQKKAIYFSYKFTEELEGLDREESELILGFLRQRILAQPDLHLRARWELGTVVLWDNRRCLHTPILDFEGSARHCYRITTLAETPVEKFEDLEDHVKELSLKLQERLNISN